MKGKKVSEGMAKAMENAEIIVRVNKAIEPMIKAGQVAGILAKGARWSAQMAKTFEWSDRATKTFEAIGKHWRLFNEWHKRELAENKRQFEGGYLEAWKIWANGQGKHIPFHHEEFFEWFLIDKFGNRPMAAPGFYDPLPKPERADYILFHQYQETQINEKLKAVAISQLESPAPSADIEKKVRETLKILGDTHPKEGQLLTKADFERLVLYTSQMMETRQLPENIEPMNPGNPPAYIIRYAVYSLQLTFFGKGKKSKRPPYADFLKAVFPQMFNNWTPEALSKKLSVKEEGWKYWSGEIDG